MTRSENTSFNHLGTEARRCQPSRNGSDQHLWGNYQTADSGDWAQISSSTPYLLFFPFRSGLSRRRGKQEILTMVPTSDRTPPLNH
jgi:hypothetical protein